MRKQSVFHLFRNRNYSLLFFAAFTSQMGNVIGLTAFMFFMLDAFSSGAEYASITQLMYSLPTLAIFPFVGVIADRMDRQKVALYSEWGQAALTLILLFSIWLKWLPLIFLVLFLRAAIGKFFDPAQAGLIQGILDKEEYSAAVGLNQMLMSLFLLFGTGLGTISYAFFGIYGAIIIDFVSFIISGLLILSCKIMRNVRLPNGKITLKDLRLSVILKEFSLGSTYIIRHRLLLSLMLGLLLFGIINGALSVIPTFIMKYHLAPEQYKEMSALVSIVFGCGVLLGSMVATKIVNAIPHYKMIITGCVMSGFFIILSVAVSDLIWFFGCYFLFAFSIPIINVPFFGWRQKIVDPKMMGRVQGWHSPLLQASHSLTLLIIAITFPAKLNVQILLSTIGAAFLLTALLYAIILPTLASKKVYIHDNTKYVI